MPLVVKDRVRETTITTGTGTITLAGAVAGFQSFSAIGNANTTYYTINLPGANEWEVGIGTYTASGTTLSRDTILASSNGGSAVNFSAGTKDVFCTYPAGKAAYLDAANNLLIGTTTNTNTSNIVANGTISETVSGTQYLVASQYDVGTNPNQIPLNQYLGDMAFQSSAGVSVGALTASGAVTLSGGTANGVVYLNASKVATTGTALTFDGTNLAVNTSATITTAAINITGYGSTALVKQRIGGFADSLYLTSNYFYNGSQNYDSISVGQAAVVVGSGVIELLTSAAGASQPTTKAIVTSTGTLNIVGAGTAGSTQAISFNGSTPVDTLVTTSGGNVGIGTSSPAVKLDVNGEIRSRTTAGFVINDGSQLGAFKYSGGLVIDRVAGSVLLFQLNGSTQATLDASGNLGLGVTPSDWNANNKVFQLTNNASLFSRSGFTGVAQNFRYNASDTGIFMSAGYATLYYQSAGSHIWTVSTTSWSGTGSDTASLSQAMTLDASGNLGLGTTSVITGARADIRGANSNNLSDLDAQVLTVFDTTSYAQNVGGGIAFGYKFNSSNSYIQRAAVIKAVKENSTDGNYASAMVFATTANGASTTERARIDSSGDFLVDKTAAAQQRGWELDVGGTSYSAVAKWYKPTTGNQYATIFYNSGGTIVGSIEYSETATAYVTSSDYRLKDNIAPMTGALAKVAALKPVTYKWKADGSDGEGFIAHELAAVVPQCVTGEKDAVDADGKPIYQGIDTSFLVATLTAAIQEQQAMINELKAEVAALKGA